MKRDNQTLDNQRLDNRKATRAPLVALLLAALTLLGSAGAQVSVEYGGTVKAEFGVAIDGHIPVAAAEVQGRLEGEVGSGFFPDAIFRAELSARYDAAASEPLTLRLGRAYATAYLGPVDLTVGNQVISWGSTDVMNPVDVLNPKDLTYPAGDPVTQKLAVPMVRAVYRAPGGVKLDAVLIPAFVPSTLPGERWTAEQQAALPGAGELPPGVSIVGVAEPLQARPEFNVKNIQFGVRATLALDVGDGADVSASYFRGFRHLPSVGALPAPAPSGAPGELVIVPLLSYDPVNVLGADFSAAVGQFVLRGEVAYTLTGAAPKQLTPLGEIEFPVGADTLEAVAGIETILPGGPFLSLQTIYTYTAAKPAGSTAPGLPAAAPEKASSAFSTALVGNHDLSGRAAIEFAWLHAWTDGSGAIRPGVSYTLADGVTLNAEAAIFYGRKGSEYGSWRDNSQLRAAITYAF